MANRLWVVFTGKITTSKWGKICKYPQDTAIRGIQDLKKKIFHQRSLTVNESQIKIIDT